MFFENEQISFNILDVLEIDQKNINTHSNIRNFDAISFRFNADTIIKTKNKELHISKHSVCFFPARVDYTRISKHDKLIVIHFNSLNYLSEKIEAYYPKNFDKLANLFLEILDCWNNKEIGYKYECSAKLNLIFLELYKDSNFENKKLYSSKIGNSIKYIQENFTDPQISVEKAAKISNISEVYFRKIFKENFGISPKKYIINARIRRAIDLIESGYYSLSEISKLTGFSDYKYFSTEFKRITGESPSKYQYSFKG